MKYTKKEIKAIEHDRTVKDIFIIRIYKEGDWYRFYEWSAYLTSLYNDELKEKEKLKLLKRSYKGIPEGLICAGMQMVSFPKYLCITTEDLKDCGDGIYEFNASEKFKACDYTTENFIDILNSVRDKIEFKNSENNDSTQSKCATNSTNTSSEYISYMCQNNVNNDEFIYKNNTSNNELLKYLCKRIIKYNIDKSSPTDNEYFIKEIKHGIAEYLFNKI